MFRNGFQMPGQMWEPSQLEALEQAGPVAQILRMDDCRYPGLGEADRSWRAHPGPDVAHRLMSKFRRR